VHAGPSRHWRRLVAPGEGLAEATLIDTPLDDKMPVDDVRRERFYTELTEFKIASRADRIQKMAKSPLQY
jgi:hypothetical protein